MASAFIFDFDGIITDTEPIHMDAWLSVFEVLGISFDEDEYHANYLGLNDRDFLDAVGRIHNHHFSDADKATLIEEKTKQTLNLLEHDVPLLPGVADFIGAIKDSHPLAICSGAGRGEIEFILRHLKWNGIFNPIVSAESVKRGKPDPEGYIRAFEGLNERSDDVLLAGSVVAIEDSPKGIESAKAAGLRCLAVSNSYPISELARADWVVSSLEDVDPTSL